MLPASHVRASRQHDALCTTRVAALRPMIFLSIFDSYGEASWLNNYWHHVEFAVRCCNLAPLCYLHTNANSGPRQLFGERPASIFFMWMCTRMADARVSTRHLHRSVQTLSDRLHGQGATVFRFEQRSLQGAYRREALSELRTMRRRACACGARVARAFHASPTFHGTDAAISLWNSAFSVCAMGVSVCKSGDGSEVRKPV